MISDLFGEMADVPLPPPNQWDPSHKSALPSAFSRTPRIPWLQRGIRNQLRYWSTLICTSQYDWESCDCRGPLTPHHTRIYRVKQRLQRPAQPIMEINYSHQFIDSLSPFLFISAVKLKKSGNSEWAFLVQSFTPNHVFVRQNPLCVERFSVGRTQSGGIVSFVWDSIVTRAAHNTRNSSW